MSKKWTKNLAIIGQIVGMFIGTTKNHYWMTSSADFAEIVGFGVPYAIIGALIGLIVDIYKAQPNEESHVKCPDCRELILKDARKCKHCGCNLIPQ